jgi:hypothetical protein
VITPHDTMQARERDAVVRDAVAPVARRPAPAREGAAMLIVMLVLLMTTGVAVFAVHTTTAEIRAAGAARQALQTHYVAESGLMSAIAYSEFIQPAGVELALERSAPPASGYMSQFFEPELAPGKRNYRLYLGDFLVGAPAGFPIEVTPTRGPSLGRSALTPFFTVDINDDYTYTSPIAGHRADGAGALRFMAATYTAHGRTRVPTDIGSDVPRLTGDTRPFLEGAADARAYVVLGPFGR